MDTTIPPKPTRGRPRKLTDGKTASVYLPASLWTAVDAIAADRGITRCDFLRTIINEAVCDSPPVP